MPGGDHCCVAGCNNDRRYPERNLKLKHIDKLSWYKVSGVEKKRLMWGKYISKGMAPGYVLKPNAVACSNHFIDGQPTGQYPYPTEYLTSFENKKIRADAQQAKNPKLEVETSEEQRHLALEIMKAGSETEFQFLTGLAQYYQSQATTIKSVKLMKLDNGSLSMEFKREDPGPDDIKEFTVSTADNPFDDLVTHATSDFGVKHVSWFEEVCDPNSPPKDTVVDCEITSYLEEASTEATTEDLTEVQETTPLGKQNFTNLEEVSTEATIEDSMEQESNTTIEFSTGKGEQNFVEDLVEVPCDSLLLSRIVESDHDYGYSRDPDLVEKASFPCSLCDMLFHSALMLYQHIKVSHESVEEETGDEMKASCNLCGLTLPSAKSLASHLKQKHDIYSLKAPCPECGKQIKKDRLQEHYEKQHTNQKTDSWLCHICAKSCNSDCALNYHLRVCHDDNTIINCDQCPATFKRMVDLKKHIERIHEGRQFQCGFCSRSLNSRTSLMTHIKVIHNAGPQKKFECEKCGLQFRQKSSLEKHTETIHLGKNGHFCEICNARFSTKMNFERHKLKHKQGKDLGGHDEQKNKEKCMPCSICAKVFGSSRKLERHIKLLHNPEKEKPFECKLCGRRFTQNNGLVLHTKAAHPRNSKYNCEVCNAGYEGKNAFEKHKLMHKS